MSLFNNYNKKLNKVLRCAENYTNAKDLENQAKALAKDMVKERDVYSADLYWKCVLTECITYVLILVSSDKSSNKSYLDAINFIKQVDKNPDCLKPIFDNSNEYTVLAHNHFVFFERTLKNPKAREDITDNAINTIINYATNVAGH